jgi:type I restriction enzyme M protein
MKQLDLFISYEKNRPKTFIRVGDLKPINNLKLIFREIRDYFAGNVTGITRDESIATNIMRILFCKIYDEKHSVDITEFCNRPDDNGNSILSRIESLFEKVKANYPDIFDKNEKIEIKSEELSVVVSKLENYSIFNADRDVIGDAFEELIGTSFRGGEGQFFTPRNVVQMMIDVLQPQEGESVIDPACGSAGFLAYTLRYFMASNIKDYYIAGIEKDMFLAKIAKIYLSLIGNASYHIFCENSLAVPSKWKIETQKHVRLGDFDVVLTNPPFGAKIPVVGGELLKQYKLGHKWANLEKWIITKQLADKQAPQVLFIERCLQLLRDGGRLGIILPEGIFGNPSDRYILQCISKEASVLGVVSLSQETFQPSTHTKTSVLFLKKTSKRPKSIFMAIASNVGHNKNGKPNYLINSDGSHVYDQSGNTVLYDDLPAIADNFRAFNRDEEKLKTHLGFSIKYEDLNDDILIPEYYNPEIDEEIESLKTSGKYNIISIGELIDEGIIQIKRGNEIGSQFYGTGVIPFVRTSDIVNWEIKFDPIKSVSEEIYGQYKLSQDIQEEDILFVNDGTFLIGRTAMVTNLDLNIIIQSHIRKIRVMDKSFIDPHYLFYLLNSKIVKKQVDSKTFVQATISTIGNRLRDIVIPISNNQKEVIKVVNEVSGIINEKAKLRKQLVKMIENSI